ncbi:MAG TPA: superoxide dismutase family protein [Polyangiaceae bacterium]|nr:superoxide dismutase family protein [Polyangiaceae bacterium]
MKLSWSLLPVLVLAACERNEGSTEAKAPAASPANAAPAAANTEAPVAPPRNGAPEAQEKPGAAPAEGTTATEPAPPAKVAGKALAAEAEFQTVKGIELDGEARFEETPEGVRIVVEVEDAPPGKRGVHIHQFADCSDIAGQSMGSHFAPRKHPHGLPTQTERHLGDLGNIEVGKDGKGRLEIVVPEANLRPGDSLSFVNRAIVIHQGEDKGTQPTGGAGKPIACGVIRPD